LKQQAEMELAAVKQEHAKQMEHMTQNEADLLDACKKTVDAGDAEIVRLNANHSSLLQSMKNDHLTELEHLKSVHSAELETLRNEHLSQLEAIRRDHVAELEHVQSKNNAELERMQYEHSQQLELIKNDHVAQQESIRSASAADLDRVQDEHLSQLESVTNKHLTEVETVKSVHITELERLRREHQREMENHAAALAAEYQRRNNEHTAEMESMALSLVSLHDELQHMKAEATLAAEPTQKTELQLAALKNQFDKDLKEMQFQHAKELEERDGCVSDAEAVLLKKEEKIEEVEEELLQMRHRLAVQLDNVCSQHLEELQTIETAHAEKIAQLNMAHAEELEWFQQEVERKVEGDEIIGLQQHIEKLESVISQGRLMIDKLKSDVASLEEQLEHTASENRELHESNTKLQMHLETVSQQNDLLQSQHAQLEQQHEQLQSKDSQCKAAEQKVFDLQRELERAAETANHENLQKIKEQQEKIEKLEDELGKLNLWADRMEVDYADRLEEIDDEIKDNERLKSELEQSTLASSKLKAEMEKLRSQNPSDSELYNQLREERLANNRLKNKLEKLQDEHERRFGQQKELIAQLEEDRRKLQNDLRRQQKAVNETYAAHHLPRAASTGVAVVMAASTTSTKTAATSTKTCAAVPVGESNGVVERFCIKHYETEITRLQHENDKKDREYQKLVKKLDDYKAYVIQAKTWRDSVKAKEKAENVETVAAALSTSDPAAAAATTESPESAEPVQKLSDCKQQ